MTKKELLSKLEDAVKINDNKTKREFRKKIKEINDKVDKLDPFYKNFFDKISLGLSLFNIDKQIAKIMYDIAENIEDPKLDKEIKDQLEALIIKYLNGNKNTVSTKESAIDNKGEEIWEETKKVRKAL